MTPALRTAIKAIMNVWVCASVLIMLQAVLGFNHYTPSICEKPGLVANKLDLLTTESPDAAALQTLLDKDYAHQQC